MSVSPRTIAGVDALEAQPKRTNIERRMLYRMVDYSHIYHVVASILLNRSRHRDLYALIGCGGDKTE
jgi:hypothetical protein